MIKIFDECVGEVLEKLHGMTLEKPHDMDSCPQGLVKLGYLRLPEIKYLRDHGARAWTDKEPSFSNYYATYVEPWMLNMSAAYRKFKENGTTFAGLSEWEFIFASMPETNSR